MGLKAQGFESMMFGFGILTTLALSATLNYTEHALSSILWGSETRSTSDMEAAIINIETV